MEELVTGPEFYSTFLMIFFKKVCDFEIPEAREYAVGMVFFTKKQKPGFFLY
ncbi:hypothetical protein AAFH68_12820 [Flavobacterium sp. CGRL1]